MMERLLACMPLPIEESVHSIHIHVAVGNIVCFKSDVLDIEGHPKLVIKAVLVNDGSETCTVGFLPRHVAMRPAEVTRLHGKFAMIIELYHEENQE